MTTCSGFARADQVFQHQRAIGEQRATGHRDGLDIAQRLHLAAMHRAGEGQGIPGGNGVAVHHMQRVAVLEHVQARQRPPCAANRIEGTPGEPGENGRAVHGLAHDLLRLAHGAGGAVLKRKAAQRQRDAFVRHARTADIHQFQRAAAPDRRPHRPHHGCRR